MYVITDDEPDALTSVHCVSSSKIAVDSEEGTTMEGVDKADKS